MRRGAHLHTHIHIHIRVGGIGDAAHDILERLADKVRLSRKPYGTVAVKRQVLRSLLAASTFLREAVPDEAGRKILEDNLTQVSNNAPATVVALKLVKIASVLETVEFRRTTATTTTAIKNALALFQNAKDEVIPNKPTTFNPHPLQPTALTQHELKHGSHVQIAEEKAKQTMIESAQKTMAKSAPSKTSGKLKGIIVCRLIVTSFFMIRHGISNMRLL